jgi:pyridoxamine 5'-phosphate oxidase
MEESLAQVQQWLDEAVAAGIPEPNAMSLATGRTNGHVSVRTVLLKGVDTGLVFYTNYLSRKGRELEWNRWCAASLTWPSLGRQVRVTGTAARCSPAVSDAYFATRPRGSQLAAWASPQSQVLPDRAELERLVAEAAARFEGQDVPRPPHWGGYRITPGEVEFWTRRDDRLHDRLRWTRAGDGWSVDRLAP